MRKLLMLASVLAAIGAAGAASAQTGNFLISNNSTTTVSLTANSFSTTLSPLTTPIAAASTGTGLVYAGGSGFTWGGTVIYTNADGIGCSFTSYAFYSSFTGRYTFSFTSAPQGGPTSPAVCGHTADRNATSGSWTSYITMSGF